MKEQNSLIYRIAEKLFYLNTIPIIPETMAGLAAYDGTLSSPWAFASLSYIILMTEVDIYIFSQPIEIQKKSWLGVLILWIMDIASRISRFFGLDFTDLTRAWKYMVTQYKFVKNMLKPKNPKHLVLLKIIINAVWYIIMLFCAIMPGVGRIANGVYVKQHKPLFGHFFLIVGCFVRFYLIFKGIAFILF